MESTVRAELTDAQFVAGLPKVELHVHLEGTIEPTTLFELASRNGVALPFDSAEGMLDYQANQKSEGNESLGNFLKCLDVSRSTLRTAQDYHLITVEFLRRCRDEGIRYVEIMFDPQQGMRQGVPLGECLDALAQAQVDGLRDYGVRSAWIMCFQRDHPPSEALSILDLASSHTTMIAGIGLDNYEIPGFPSRFKPVFDQAKTDGFRLTSHCDVNQGNSLAHIRSCISELGVERIDHGLNAVEDPALIELIREHGIALTGCPTFYAGQPGAPREELDMLRSLLHSGVRVSLNTDDPAQFGNGWLTSTTLSAMKDAPFSRSEIVQFAMNAIESAWVDSHIRNQLVAELQAFCASVELPNR